MFSYLSPQALHFGRGQRHQTVKLAQGYGHSVLVVHGSNAKRAEWLVEACREAGLYVTTRACAQEPTLPDLEAALKDVRGDAPDVVIGLGGGSVLDFAKALAALIPAKGAVQDYLEVVGTGRVLEQAPLPMIALPTTAGTGSEATKNAVIAVPERGLKVSLRDGRMIPDAAIVDPDLMQGAPRHVVLAAGLDAVTQVIEPYLNSKANPMTDAICVPAIPVGLAALCDLVERDDHDAWDSMAWVSTCGGLALANAGLGPVHGFAGVIGGRTGAPHGEICGTLLPVVLAAHLARAEVGTELHRRLDWIISHVDLHFAGERHDGLSGLTDWSKDLGLRGLEAMGLGPEQFLEVAETSSRAATMKGNPYTYEAGALLELLEAAK